MDRIILHIDMDADFFFVVGGGDAAGEGDFLVATGVDNHLRSPILSRMDRIEPSGLILGFLPDQVYATAEVRLEPGDIVLLYTDGITEAMSSSGEMFGAARLKEVVSSGAQDPRQLLASISRSVEEHAAGHPQSDDLTMVCFAVD